MTAPTQVNPSIFLSLEPAAYSAAVFDAQTDKLKAIIMASPEWQSLAKRSAAPAGDFDNMPDDLPWKNEEEVDF